MIRLRVDDCPKENTENASLWYECLIKKHYFLSWIWLDYSHLLHYITWSVPGMLFYWKSVNWSPFKSNAVWCHSCQYNVLKAIKSHPASISAKFLYLISAVIIRILSEYSSKVKLQCDSFSLLLQPWMHGQCVNWPCLASMNCSNIPCRVHEGAIGLYKTQRMWTVNPSLKLLKPAKSYRRTIWKYWVSFNIGMKNRVRVAGSIPSSGKNFNYALVGCESRR